MNFKIVFLLILFIAFRPFLGDFLFLRIGEGLTLIFSILILVSKRNIVFKFELIPIIIILLSLSIVSVYLNLNNQTSQDLIDPVRLIIPILLFTVGYNSKLNRKSINQIFKFIIIPQFFLIFFQEIDFPNVDSDLIYNVKELSRWGRSAGSFSNHIEPTWLLLIFSIWLRIEKISLKRKILLYTFLLFLFSFTNSKALLIIGILGYLNFINLRNLNIIQIIFVSSVFILLSGFFIFSSDYFMNTINHFQNDSIENDPSSYIRLLDYTEITELLINGSNIFFGFGASSKLGYDGYMGTSSLMIIYRYGFVSMILYYSIIKKLFHKRFKYTIIILIILFDSISNGSEALKGSTLFFLLLGIIQNYYHEQILNSNN